MNDTRILELYNARDEEAIEQTRLCYGSKLLAVAMRILEDKPDAEECENDTYLKTWNSIPPNQPVYFLAYIVKICRNTALGMLEKRGAQKRSAQVVELTGEMEQCIPDAMAEREFDPEGLGTLLSTFLRTETKDNRTIFVRRYLMEESVAEVAEALGFAESKVKSSLLRTRGKLKEYLEKEGVRI